MLAQRQDESSLDYVLLSDIHLGADLVEHVRPWSRDSWLSHQAEIDDRLSSMIAHHVGAAARPIQFVIAGDFVDFIGMSISAPRTARLRRGLTSEEEAHGLGCTPDRSAFKVRAVAERHASVFRTLAAALDRGHRLAIVHGNHDTEWYWLSARRAFLDCLAAQLEPGRREPLKSKVSFHPWFFYVPGLLYVEHGHEYDPMCGYGDPLVPVCPRNPQRIRSTPSSILLRYVARPTRGLSTFGHEHAGFVTYLRLVGSFGVVGALRLFRRFATASLRLLVDTRTLRGADLRLRRKSGLRLRVLARQHDLAPEALVQLRALHVRPVAGSVRLVLRSLYWDRLALFAFVWLAWALLLASTPYAEAVGWSLLATVCAALFGVLSSRDDIDPAPRMRAGARAIAARLGVRYVVMGHTHEPVLESLGTDASYVNLGHWGQDELPEDRAQCLAVPVSSYFHVTSGPEGRRAALYAWDRLLGARLLVTPAENVTEPMREPLPARSGDAQVAASATILST